MSLTIGRAACQMLVVLLVFFIPGCSSSPTKSSGPTPRLRLATTTSTRDSGLLDELLPLFESQHRCRVDVIAVGSGAALKLGQRGDVDAVIVHARKAEEAFMKAGHGERHEEFMYNDFVILGPENDPAEIRERPPTEALRLIAERQQTFISRADESGTHQREIQLWESAGIEPAWGDYVQSGQGMGPTLVMADQQRAYVLADRGTYLKFQDKTELVPLAATDARMRNPYAAIVVHRQRHPQVQTELAGKFVDFLISIETQKLIAAYRVAGEPVFHPTRLQKN